MPSRAFRLFNGRRKREILEIACVFEEINARPGPNTKYSLLNGALVLLVSSWEVYCEDVCLQAAKEIQSRPSLRFAQLDERLQKDLIQYAGKQYTGKQDPLSEKLAMLPDGRWRQLLLDRLNDYLPEFNTPKFSRNRGKDLNDLFRHILGIRSMSTALEDFVEENGLSGHLDAVVTLRGEIAHTGDAESRLSPRILRQHTESFIEAAAAVDSIIYQEFRNNLGFAPWQITEKIRQALRPIARDKL
ncbi:MAG: HEPN domain-containing protein [Gemmatimonadota bacterium]|nr:HEPN domain-containing protein [Gemmatimonadota bacterium]